MARRGTNRPASPRATPCRGDYRCLPARARRCASWPSAPTFRASSPRRVRRAGCDQCPAVPDRTCPSLRTSLRNGRAYAIRAARCCKRAVMEPCELSLRDNGQTRNARAGGRGAHVSPCGTWREGQARGNARLRKSNTRSSPAQDSPRRPRARNARYRRRRSRHGTMGDGEIVRGAIGEKARGLLDRIKRGGAALFEIAEGEDAGAKLRECPVRSQCETAHFLRCFFFAVGFDFAPVVLGAPLAVGPMLHLVGSPCSHRVPPMFRARGGYKSFLATIGRHASTIVNSLAVVLPFSNRGRSARQKPVVHTRIVAPAVVNEALTRPESPPIFCAGPAPCAFLARRGASCRRKPSRLRPSHRGKVLQSRQAGRGPHRFRLLQPRHPIFPRPFDPARTEVVTTAFL